MSLTLELLPSICPGMLASIGYHYHYPMYSVLHTFFWTIEGEQYTF